MRGHHSTHFTAERIARTGCTVGETPVWEPEHKRVTWLDSPGAALYRVTYPDGVVERFDLPLRVGALAIHADGGFIDRKSVV